MCQFKHSLNSSIAGANTVYYTPGLVEYDSLQLGYLKEVLDHFGLDPVRRLSGDLS